MKLLLFIFFFLLVKLVFSQTAPLTVSVSTTKYSCTGGTATISIEGGTAPFYYNWNNGYQGASQTNLSPGNYNVSIVDGKGKDTLISFTIEEEKCKVSISNSFSPNGDDINDTWGISKWQNYPDFKLFVYNRWGQLVHSQKGEYIPWDGKQLGVDLPVATYYYVFYYSSDKEDIEKGSVTIMR